MTDIAWLISCLIIILPLLPLLYVLREKHRAEEKARDCIKEIAKIGIDILIKELGLEEGSEK